MKIPNSPPFPPSINGPISGKAGEEYEYAFATTDPDGDDVYYYMEWGDGQIEEWIGPYTSEEIYLPHIWNEQGLYTIKIKAKDSHDGESEWATLEISMPKNIQTTNNDNTPPNPPEITGPLSGMIRKTYEYQLTLTDPDDGDVMFNLEIDFGEGIKYEDCGCGKSWQNGTVLEVSNQWKNVGNYEITARVQDAYGEWSEWSEPLSISMPRIKDRLINSLYLRLSEQHPHLLPLLRQLLRL